MTKITIEELIEKLEKYPSDMQVILSGDEEGDVYYEDIIPENSNNLVVLYPVGTSIEIDEAEDFADEYDEEY